MFRRLRPLFRRAAAERELDTELAFDIEQRVRDLVATGLPETEARRRVRLEFGDIGQVKDDCRDARFIALFDSLIQDLRYGVRVLSKSPAFTVVAVLSLALGIGANTAIFSLLDQVLMKPLAIAGADEVMLFRSPGLSPGMHRNTGTKMSFSWPKYKEFRDKAKCFQGVAARYPDGASLTYQGQTDRVLLELVTGNYFDLLGIRPAAGRLFKPEDDKTWRAEPWVVLSHEYWMHRFGGDHAIIGQPVRINDAAMTVIGVAAEGFHGMQRGSAFDIFVPMMMKSFITPMWPQVNQPFWAWLNIVARRKPGVSREQAEAEANVLYKQILNEEAAQVPAGWLQPSEIAEFRGRKLELVPGARGITWGTEHLATPIFALMAMVAIVLLIACVNVANLLMARAAKREREVAIRAALGAGRWRVLRQLLVESLLLGAAGGAVGLLASALLGEFVVSLLLGAEAGRIYSIAPDARALAFTLGISLLTVVIFGIAPAFQLARTPLFESLKSEGRTSASAGVVRFGKVLVTMQVAFCVVLMVGAALFVRTLHNLRNVDLGFDRSNLLTFSLNASTAGYDEKRTERTYRDIESVLSRLPGVESASVSSYGVLKGSVNSSRYAIDGYQPKNPEDTNVAEVAASPAYLRSLGFRLLAGRLFNEAEYDTGRVAVVNESFVQKYFNGRDGIGRTLRTGEKAPPITIVGVLRNEKYMMLQEDPQPRIFIPKLWFGEVTYYLRTHLPASSLVTEIRRVVSQAAPGVPLYDIRTMDEQLDRRMRMERMAATLAVCFGVIATFLAALGLYGVISYVVARRTRDIGVRIAMGASRTSVVTMVVRDIAWLAGIGVEIGVAGALATARYLASSLFGVEPTDVPSIVAAVVVVCLVAVLAGFAPARRASSIDPVLALRAE